MPWIHTSSDSLRILAASLRKPTRVAAGSPRSDDIRMLPWSCFDPPRQAWGVLIALLAVYAIAFAACYPSAITVSDEGNYIRESRLLLAGTTKLERPDAFSGEMRAVQTILYPIGTALLMAPFVWLAGWQGAFVSSFLCLLVGVLVTARWLQDEGRSPLFAALILGFPPTLVMARVAMSDVPSMAVGALGLWLFWRGLERGWLPWFASGLVAGASMTIRDSNCLLFAPLFAGAVLRRERRSWALLVGGLVGVGLRCLAAWLAFGDPFYSKDTYPFSPGTIAERLPFYLLALLVCVPGGLVFALAYRGKRRVEVVTTVVIFFFFYLLQGFSIAASALEKRAVLSLRYFIPLLPLLAFATAEAAPRIWRRVLARQGPERQRALTRAAGIAVAAWLLAVALGAGLLNWGHSRWSWSQAEIRAEIERHTLEAPVIITNWRATGKFFDLMREARLPLRRDAVNSESIEWLLGRHGKVVVVLLDRADSPFWREESRRNELFLALLLTRPSVELDRAVTSTDRLRIYSLTHPAAAAAPPLP